MSPACEVLWSAWAHLFSGQIRALIELLPIVGCLWVLWVLLEKAPPPANHFFLRRRKLIAPAVIFMLAALARVPAMLSYLLEC